MARILHLIASNHRRGAENFSVRLAEHFRSAGHEVRVMAVQGSNSLQPFDVEVAGSARLDPRGIAKVISAARWSDVVVSFGSSSLIVGSVAAKVSHRPFIYRNIGDPTVWGSVKWSSLRIGAPARSARRLVVIYPAAGEALTRLYDVDPGIIRLIPPGVPDDRFPPADSSERLAAQTTLGLDPGHRWIAYVGALSPEKDPLIAVDALAHLDEHIGLVIAGSGPMTDEVKERASRFKDRVVMLGSVEDVTPVYAASEALVLPSLTEGVPGVAIEAGMAGLPVAAFDVGGVTSVVLDGLTGRIADERTPSCLANNLEVCLEEGHRFGPAAREHCLQNFSIQQVGRAWEQVLTEVLGGWHDRS